MMRLKQYIILSLLVFCTQNLSAQSIAVKSNMLYDAFGIASLGVEWKTSKHGTMNLMGSYNPLQYGAAKWKNFSLQPEYRYWFHRAFTGPFVAANVAWGGFNTDKIHIGKLYGKHRQGHFLGGGVGGGYHLILNSRLSLDFTLEVDLLHCKYDKYREGDIPYLEGKYTSNVVLPIGSGISLAVML